MPAATSSNNDVVSKNDESLAIVAAVASSSASDEGVRPPTSSVENQVDAVSIINDTLTYTQWRNLMLCFLAWACIVSNQTLVVGTSAVAILAIGGADNLATVPLGVFVYGSAFVSGTGLTSTVFSRYGRKVGFVMGIGMGLVGTVLACVSVVGASPALYIVANILYGMALGVGMHMRFAAVEIVPPSAAARAVTLVVSGGCIAAFAGPEAAAATQNWIADAPFLGTYIMTGIFYLLNLFFTILVDFTPPPPPPPAKRDAKLAETPSAVPAGDDDEDEASERADEYSRADLLQILLSRQFWIPTWTATVSWIGMALPMGLVRVAMSQVGYSSRDTLTTIELHFLGMFAPGFVVGRWIQRYGPAKVSIASVVVFGVAMALTLTCRAADDLVQSQRGYSV